MDFDHGPRAGTTGHSRRPRSRAFAHGWAHDDEIS